jgi:tripartite-type tricarboxylate transporter receptor subunit TctC
MSWSLKIAALATATSLSFAAQSQPGVRIITGSSPGAPVDTLARTVAEPMASLLNRTIIVESKPGASYNIAADYVAKAAPDGNTILLTFNVHAMSGLLYGNLPFDPIKDFRAIGMVAAVPYAVIANPSLPGSSLKEMIALAKAQGRSPSFATIGQGTPHHLMMEGVKGQTGADFRMVHYKSASQALMDVVAGHVDFSLLTPSALIETQVKSAKLKVIAVTSSQRLPEYPNTPTVAEMGYQGFVTDGWYAMLVPAKTPPAVVKTYNEALNKVLAMPAMQARLRGIGSVPKPGAPEVVEQQIQADAGMWRKIITDNKIKVE